MNNSSLQEGLQYIYNLLTLFRQAKEDNGQTFINELNKISKDGVASMLKSYGNEGEKVRRIRIEIIKKLSSQDITMQDVEQIKQTEKNKHSNDILRSRTNFAILYSLYYYFHKNKVKEFLQTLQESLISDLGIQDKVQYTIVDFDGAQNFGLDNFWTAIYNKSHKSQKTALQLNVSSFTGLGKNEQQLSPESISVGLGHGPDYKGNVQGNETPFLLKDISYQTILDTMQPYVQDIIDDNYVNQERDITPIKKIVDAYINEYISWRNSDAWNEKYKRETLPTIADVVFKDERTHDNVSNKIQYLDKHKQNRVSYMGNLSDLKQIAETYPDDLLQARQKLLKDAPTNTVGTRIDKFLKKVKALGIKSNLGTPMFGYIFASQHPEQYPIYKDEIFQYAIKGIANEGAVKKNDIGGKYQLFVALCKKISAHMQEKQYLLQYSTKEPIFSGSIMDAQDFLYFIQTFDKMSTENLGGAVQQLAVQNAIPKNTILYGVPGTGKTYATITYAVAMIENKPLEEVRREERTEVKERYEKYRADGQVVFTTFHQSYGYEDFVEGVKAEVEEGDIAYNVVDGVLKEICSLASAENVVAQSGEKIDVDGVNIFKMSLGEAKKDDDIYEYCMQNNVVALGFAKDINFSGLSNTPDHKKSKAEISKFLEELDKTTGGKIEDKFLIDGLYRFKNWIQNGDLVFISNGNSKLRAIGQVTSDYYYDDLTQINYTHFRKVNWLLKDVDIPVAKIQSKKFSQQSIYNLKDDSRKTTGLYLDVIKELLGQGKQEQKNYVLIIDEINRGNISKIFGELITLLEDDKRGGASEALTVTLPYSKKPFSIPNNLYVIGTMNTADRSIALMDLALRRRFYFQEVHPDSSLLEGIEVEGINIKQLFETINNRIEYLYDADHRLGHAFFLSLKENATLSHLNHIFLNKIIPLLQEYFYDDYEKIQIVLGDHSEQGLKDSADNFIVKYETKEQQVLGFDYEGAEESKATYVINSALINGTLSSNAYKGIYTTTTSKNA